MEIDYFAGKEKEWIVWKHFETCVLKWNLLYGRFTIAVIKLSRNSWSKKENFCPFKATRNFTKCFGTLTCSIDVIKSIDLCNVDFHRAQNQYYNAYSHSYVYTHTFTKNGDCKNEALHWFVVKRFADLRDARGLHLPRHLLQTSLWSFQKDGIGPWHLF